MRYTTEVETATTLAASASITFRDNDTIEAIKLSGTFRSSTVGERLFVVASFSQNTPGGSPEDHTFIDQEDVIAAIEIPAVFRRYWNGTTAIGYALDAEKSEILTLPTGIPVLQGDRVFLHAYSTNGAILTDPKYASMIIHTKTQLKVTRRR